MNTYPTYKEFKECKFLFGKRTKPLNNFIAIPLYGLSIIGLTLIIVMIAFMVASVLCKNSRPSKYPRDKYRKVVKEGIFWDSIEWHER